MVMKLKILMIMILDNFFLCLILFNGWRGYVYSSLKYLVYIGLKFFMEYCFCEFYFYLKFLLFRFFVVIVV